jgi:integrase
MSGSHVVFRFGYEIEVPPIQEGIYRIRTGGYLIRVKVKELGKQTTKQKVLHGGKLAQAQVERLRLKQDVKSRPRTLFSEFATSLYERKVLAGDLGPKTREKWDGALTHHILPAFGAAYCDELKLAHFAKWASNSVRKFKPVTINTWLSILQVICKSMTIELDLGRNPYDGMTPLNVMSRYTEEDPNSLTPEQCKLFLAEMKQSFPQFYAMTLLGFATGLRPSTLRPIRKGKDLVGNILLVRRSNAVGDTIVETTKTKKHQKITLPDEVVEVMLTQARTYAKDSEYLFPGDTGGLRSRSSLDKPFAAVCSKLGLPRLTPKGMRRTFQDLCRAAEVRDVVTRSISGHATETMQQHYSTVRGEEMKEGIGKLLRLVV